MKEQKAPSAKVQMVAVTSEDEGQRLDNFLMRFLRKAPKTLVTELFARVRCVSIKGVPKHRIA
jgi:hypothetical protein